VLFQARRSGEARDMSEPLLVWAKVTLRLGLVLLAIGLIPLILQQFVLTDISPIVPVLLSVMVAPLGVIITVLSLILFLAALVRRRRGSS
jgi:hypothetical protein